MDAKKLLRIRTIEPINRFLGTLHSQHKETASISDISTSTQITIVFTLLSCYQSHYSTTPVDSRREQSRNKFNAAGPKIVRCGQGSFEMCIGKISSYDIMQRSPRK